MKKEKGLTVILRVHLLALLLLAFFVDGSARGDTKISESLRKQQFARLQTFATEKEKQSLALASAAGEKISPEFRHFFDAAIQGDWQTVTNIYAGFKKRHPQYDNKNPDLNLRVSYWSPALEIGIAYDHVATCEPRYTEMAVNGIINSIPSGSIYFGGTDPGRGLITAFSKSHVKGDPFFTLTQNALADGTYLKYLRTMFGDKIYTPRDEDSQRCFNEYLADVTQRYKDNKLKPGEDFKMEDGRTQVSGQVAVMSINGLLSKTVFDKNPKREFFVEESFPLDWMYPHLEPHGLILKINRQPLKELSEKSVQEDFHYWQAPLAEMIGSWLNQDTSVKTVAEFAEKVCLRKDFNDFNGDPQFVQNEAARKFFSKLRSSIGGVYAWRISNSKTPAEQTRMVRAADLAFRQAWALCPDSPEAVYRYVNLLLAQNRIPDAILVAQTCQKLDPKNASIDSLVGQLETMQKAQNPK